MGEAQRRESGEGVETNLRRSLMPTRPRHDYTLRRLSSNPLLRDTATPTGPRDGGVTPYSWIDFDSAHAPPTPPPSSPYGEPACYEHDGPFLQNLLAVANFSSKHQRGRPSLSIVSSPTSSFTSTYEGTFSTLAPSLDPFDFKVGESDDEGFGETTDKMEDYFSHAASTGWTQEDDISHLSLSGSSERQLDVAWDTDAEYPPLSTPTLSPQRWLENVVEEEEEGDSDTQGSEAVEVEGR